MALRWLHNFDQDLGLSALNQLLQHRLQHLHRDHHLADDHDAILDGVGFKSLYTDLQQQRPKEVGPAYHASFWWVSP